VGIIEGFRWALVGASPPDFTMLAVSTASVLVLFTAAL